MRIVNVIELLNGIISGVSSFVIEDDTETPHPQVEAAEAHFLSVIRENGFDGEDDEALDNAQWEDHNGYEAVLTWSTVM